MLKADFTSTPANQAHESSRKGTSKRICPPLCAPLWPSKRLFQKRPPGNVFLVFFTLQIAFAYPLSPGLPPGQPPLSARSNVGGQASIDNNIWESTHFVKKKKVASDARCHYITISSLDRLLLLGRLLLLDTLLLLGRLGWIKRRGCRLSMTRDITTRDYEAKRSAGAK